MLLIYVKRFFHTDWLLRIIADSLNFKMLKGSLTLCLATSTALLLVPRQIEALQTASDPIWLTR